MTRQAPHLYASLQNQIHALTGCYVLINNIIIIYQLFTVKGLVAYESGWMVCESVYRCESVCCSYIRVYL